MRYWILLPLGILLSGCSDPSALYGKPEIALPDKYSVVAAVQTPTRDELEWWHRFNDPLLNQLIARGMKDNLSIADAQARLRESAANVRGAGVAVTGSGEIEVSGNSPGSDRFDTSLSAQINVAGETARRREAAEARFAAAKDNEADARRLVLSEIASAYADLRFFQTTRERRAQDLRSRRRTTRDIQTQLEAGEATRLDVLRARSLVAETRSEIPQLDANIIRQRNRLSTLLGRPVGSLPIDLGYKGTQPLPKGSENLGVPADLIRMRPDIRRAEQLYAAAVSDVGAAHAARYPNLSLSGLISAPLHGGSVSDSLAAGLVLPVFNQPILKASVDGAEARVEQAYLQWRIAVLNAVEEVENAQVLLQAALAATNASRTAVDLNRQSLKLSRELVVNGGNITVLDVLDRERALSASRTALAQNQRDVAASYIALHVALGRGHPLLAEEAETDAEVTRNEVVTAITASEDMAVSQ